MSEPKQERPAELGLFGRAEPQSGMTSAEVVAIFLSAAWIIAVVLYVVLAKPAIGGSTSLVLTLLMVFLPLAMIWAAILTARTVRGLRDEARRLHSTVEAMRIAYIQQQQAASAGVKPSVERKLDEIASAQKHAETTLATFTSRRDLTLVEPSADRKAVLAAPRPASADEQPVLALGTPAEEMRPPLSVSDFVQALNFPDSPDDKAGFRAMRLALEDRGVAKLIRAAQDVLTLLSQEGIYMDDLKPDRARPEIWRKFAQGERGRTIAALGGVRDRSSLALTAARMRQDPVFRDAAHHFLRQFDRTVSEFEKNATDQDIAELAETRTARAFMLFGRVTGTFD